MYSFMHLFFLSKGLPQSVVIWLEILAKMNCIKNTGKQGIFSTSCARNIPKIVCKKTRRNYDGLKACCLCQLLYMYLCFLLPQVQERKEIQSSILIEKQFFQDNVSTFTRF